MPNSFLLLRLDSANLHIQMFQLGAEKGTGLPLVDKSKCNHLIWLLQTKHRLGSLFRTNRIRRNSIAKPMNTMDNLKESAILLQFIKQVYVNFGEILTATKRLLPLDWTISSKVYRHVQLHLFKRNRYLTLRRCDGGRNSFPSC